MGVVACGDEAISDGIRAMLAERAIQAEEIDRERASQNWTGYQLADRTLLEALRANRSDWVEFTDAGKREAALQRFRSYAYQWY